MQQGMRPSGSELNGIIGTAMDQAFARHRNERLMDEARKGGVSLLELRDRIDWTPVAKKIEEHDPRYIRTREDSRYKYPHLEHVGRTRFGDNHDGRFSVYHLGKGEPHPLKISIERRLLDKFKKITGEEPPMRGQDAPSTDNHKRKEPERETDTRSETDMRDEAKRRKREQKSYLAFMHAAKPTIPISNLIRSPGVGGASGPAHDFLRSVGGFTTRQLPVKVHAPEGSRLAVPSDAPSFIFNNRRAAMRVRQ